MISIESYLNDGANWQAQAVLVCLRASVSSVTDCAWNEKKRRSDAEIKVGRYENCREQGYVFTLSHDYRQVSHYAVYEHRNSDELIIVKFDGCFINTPTVNDVMKDRSKYDYTKSFKCGEIVKCVDYLIDEMRKDLLLFIDNLKKVEDLSKLK